MAKAAKKAKSPAKSAKRKVAIRDLKAKDAGSVKGGILSNLAFPKLIADKDIKLNIISSADKW